MSLVGKQSNYWKLWPVWLPGSTRAASPGYPAAAPENLANWCLFGVSDPLKEGEGAVANATVTEFREFCLLTYIPVQFSGQ